jgi:hypothetical protein
MASNSEARAKSPIPIAYVWRMAWPVLLLAIGVVVKLAIVDDELSAQTDKVAFVVKRYASDFWVEILIASWISAASTLASKNLSIATLNGKWLTAFPLGSALLCVVWLTLTAKLGHMDAWIRIWSPLLVGLVCLAVVTGIAVKTGSKA